MFSLYFLSTHNSEQLENDVSISEHLDSQLDIFSFIRHLLFIKCLICEIYLFWPTIYMYFNTVAIHEINTDNLYQSIQWVSPRD